MYRCQRHAFCVLVMLLSRRMCNILDQQPTSNNGIHTRPSQTCSLRKTPSKHNNVRVTTSRRSAHQHYTSRLHVSENRQLSATVKPHRVVDAVIFVVLVGFVRPHSHPRPSCVRDRVADNLGFVSATGNACRVSISRQIW